MHTFASIRRCALLLPAALLFVLASARPATATASDDGAIHVPVPTGWTATGDEYRYDRENLWEYIDGAAELFLSYDFRELIVQDIEQDDRYLSVSVYDMGRPLDAFGVFERESPADTAPLEDIGALAVLQPPYRGLLLKQRFYVKAEVGGGEFTDEQLAEVLRAVADGLPGNDDLPPELSQLPNSGRVKGSVAYSGQAYLGLSELQGCLHADYALPDGTTFSLFVLEPRRALLENISGRWTRTELPDGRFRLWREIPYAGVVVLEGNEQYMIGISGVDDVERALALLTAVTE